MAWIPVIKSFVVVCCQNWHWTKVNGCVSTGDRRKFTAARIPPSIGSIWWYTAMLIGSQFSALISIFHEFLIGVNGFHTNKIFKNRTFLKSSIGSRRLMLSNRLSVSNETKTNFLSTIRLTSQNFNYSPKRVRRLERLLHSLENSYE